MKTINFTWDNNKAKLKVLTIVHCYRDDENNIRIISARKSTKLETKQYREYIS